MSPTGPNYPSAAQSYTGAGTAWTSPTNVYAADGVYASATLSGGGYSNNLIATGFGFSIPVTAQINGIYCEVLRYGQAAQTLSVQMMNNTIPVGTAKSPGDFWPSTAGTIAWQGYGGPSDLWGTTWTPAQVNSSNFGFEVSVLNTHGGGTVNIDAMRVTIYWSVAPTNVAKRYIYKVFSNSGTYLGNLPIPKNDFQFSQEMNTAGTQISIEVPVSADTSNQSVTNYTNESGITYTDESGSNTYTTEGAVPIVSPGSFSTGAMIKNGNGLQVWEYGYYWPNGQCLFQGQIQRWEADFGGSGGDDSIKILAYSDGQDLDNFLVRGNPYTYTTDVDQEISGQSVVSSSSGVSYDYFGQSWVVGTGVTNLGALTLRMNGAATVTINVYDGPWSGNTLLGSVTQAISLGGWTNVQFAFDDPISVTAANSYFFAVMVAPGQSIQVANSTANPYGGGTQYEANYGGGGSGGWAATTGADLFFITASGTGSTNGSFPTQDPTTGMLETILNDYSTRGGKITYSSSTIQATGLSLSAQFQVRTVLEAIQTILTLSPAGFYWYVDVGTDTLYFKQTHTTPDIVLTKGKHIGQLTFISSIENIKNDVYFTGGVPSGGTQNIYVEKNSQTSVALYGSRLDRPSNSSVIDTATAQQVATAEVLEYKDEQYQTTVTIIDKTMDTTQIKPGMTVGFNGFGTFVDSVMAQVVRIDYSPDGVALTLGSLPKRLHAQFDAVTRGLLALQTIANPTTPS